MPSASASTANRPTIAAPVASVADRWAAAVQSCGSIRAAVKQHPELHAEYLAEVNAPRTSAVESEIAKTKARLAALKH